jgi:catechol 2,3-dioxygenase-like lactoylglutathione lyase family enzyme
MAAVSVNAFDHLVVRCADVERTLAWYVDRLGMIPMRVDEWRRGEVPFPSVRASEDTIIDLVAGPGVDGRLDHICLVVEPVDLGAIAASGEFVVVEGPVRRFGARGDGTSLYVRDPDGLVVELRHYG